MSVTASRPRRVPRLAVALALGLAFGTAGCETLDQFNPFDQKKPPLPGTRQQVFPEGVPGVDYSAAPTQPSNANAPVDQGQNQQQGQQRR